MASQPARRSPVAVVRRARAAWRRLSPFLGGGRRALLALAAASIVAGLAEAALLALVAVLAAALSTGQSNVDADLGPVALSSGLPLLFAIGFALAVLRTATQVLLAYLPARLSSNATVRLRRQLFEAFVGTSWTVQAGERDGYLQSLMGGHIGHAASAIIAVGAAMSAALVFATLLLAAFALSLPTAIVLIVSSIALFALLQPLSRRLRVSAKALSAETVAFSKGVQDITRLAEETQVFGASPAYRSEVAHLIDQVRRPFLRTRFLSRLVPVLYQSAALFLLLVALGAVAVVGAGDLAALGAVVLLLLRSMTYGQQLLTALTKLDESVPFMNRLREALDHYLTHPRQSGSDPVPPVTSLGLRQVSFSYRRGEPTLSDVDFEVRAGEAVGIVGPSGAGKSTLVQLLLRLRDPDEGSVHIGGTDVRQFQLEDWQRRVAYVPQTPQLLHGTVRDNIRFHRPWITGEQVERAARQAHLHEEILTWAAGYETPLGHRVGAVSGGQKQRLCLARALAGEPDVLILDEPTSALDVKSEMLVGQSLEELKGSVMMFLVAHRLSTLAVCDRVMVMAGGRLHAFEKPAVLAETNAFYREAVQITRQQSAL